MPDRGRERTTGRIQDQNYAWQGKRRNGPMSAAQGAQGSGGAVLEQGAFLLRFGRGREVRLLLVNLGRDLHKASLPEPLLAPPAGCKWHLA
jgi:maltooligosyltrehalose trehalohydrolase